MASNATPRKLLVIGGSLAGLIAGNRFHRMGWDVHVFERAHGQLEGRGAGITMLPGLVESFQAAGAPETETSIGVELHTRIALDRAGNIVAQREFSQYMTSWGKLYEALKRVFPAERYHSGMNLTHVEQSPGRVTAVFSDGQRIDGDLLIGADGLRSTIRTQFLPDLEPHYAGYVAWRCLTDEQALSAAVFGPLFQHYAVCVAPGHQGIGYAVPGPDHSLTPGHRQYNVVWYHPVREAEDLPRYMTDDTGRYHPNGIPPALVSARLKQDVVDKAQDALAPQFAAALARGRMHFFQPIVDIEPPRLVFGRVAIVGDAAFVARPHVAMGVPKGAGDVLEIAAALERTSGDIDAAIADFEERRLRYGRTLVARGRYLGAYMEAQLKSATERQQAEAARVPEQVMMETAAPLDYEAMARAS